MGSLKGAVLNGSSPHLLDSVQRRFGRSALDFGRVLRCWWIGRKIAFESVPG